MATKERDGSPICPLPNTGLAACVQDGQVSGKNTSSITNLDLAYLDLLDAARNGDYNKVKV